MVTKLDYTPLDLKYRLPQDKQARIGWLEYIVNRKSRKPVDPELIAELKRLKDGN